ncbi:putative WRY family protein 3 [Candida maltosa Xu316]|uniref:Putative WRY family protein 3 n=1 Tax=Candida maltosa (strain Xu316) TaxID=1245528 RepID=M3JFJ7_CANMX|nr:putative WRY family protein 3 [Candida maltosa Xu316]
MKVSLHKLLSRLYTDLQNGDEYLKELEPIILPQLKFQLEMNVVDEFWYRFAGSSIWLDQYGVYYTISRVIYSPKGIKNQPTLSLMYAQIFDRDWNELTGELVVPTNDLKTGDETMFTKIKFPSLLPIPFWHDCDNLRGNYYGPEDPRLVVIQNKQGDEEPVIVFNSYHRKLEYFDDDEDEMLVRDLRFYRTMFIAYPWRFQRGKLNVEALSNKEYNRKIYTKIIELKIENMELLKTQKNWTPFVSPHDKGYIKFVYRWKDLEILKCDLESGVCVFEYRMKEHLPSSTKIGPFRGGTQLIEINQIYPGISQHFPSSTEVFIGFARTHLDDCGCGSVMYRPNLVILIKDSQSRYKITHISSSLSLDIPITGWGNPKNLCYDSNVLIPYSIANWEVHEISSADNVWKTTDYTTLTLSVSDSIIYRITIRGLLQTILNFKGIFATTYEYNNDNLVCALNASIEFCYQYGEDFYKQQSLKTIEEQVADEEFDLVNPRKNTYFKVLNRYLYNESRK